MDTDELLEKVETLQNHIVVSVDGGGNLAEFKALREELLAIPEVKEALPKFVRIHSDFGQILFYFKKEGSKPT